MDRYFRVELDGDRARDGCERVAVCRAASREEAVAQLPPDMRRRVCRVVTCASMRNCYAHPKGILRDEVI